MSRVTRRRFLKQSAAAAGAAAVFTISGTKASGRVLGANDRVRVAIAGIRGRGQSHMEAYSKAKNVEIAYLVDPDSRLFGERSKKVEGLNHTTPKCVQDLREALEDKELDAVSIATTNHSHALLAIWACQAGKDVYVEKPCCHNIFEGRKLVEAARKYDRIVQHGTQSRSSQGWAKAVAAVHSGQYGKLLISYAYASKPRGSIGFKDPKDPPEGFNFDIWLGPAQQQAYHENIVHYNWHWFWDFGNGEIGNQGIHQLDIARWAMPVGAMPKSVVSLGGRFGYKDQGQTPNTQFTVIDFGEAKLFMEDRGLVDGKTHKVANEFYTDAGVIKNNKFFPNGKTEGEELKNASTEWNENEGSHFSNFIDCVRSRDREKLHAEIEVGFQSALLAHLGNISYRLGTDVPFNKEMKAFGDDKTAYESFESMKSHLADVAKLKLDESTYRLGRSLNYDAKAEKFVGDDEANQLLTRPYRKPYVVPEQV
jgi:predicted dehydrogenase